MNKLFIITISIQFMFISGIINVSGSEINMDKVKALSNSQVKDIVKGTGISELDHESYWQKVMTSSKPVVVMFYSNRDKESQNLATLVRQIALEYSNKIIFFSMMVSEANKPDLEAKMNFLRRYGLDKTPGIFFYDLRKGKMVLEGKKYKIPRFKEYRTPGMILWKVYYSKVKEYINKEILD